jgi:hypothetical protein
MLVNKENFAVAITMFSTWCVVYRCGTVARARHNRRLIISVRLTLFLILPSFARQNKYIQDFYGFQDYDITVLMDDGNHVEPTKQNILDAYIKIVAESQPGDVIFLHYSGE